MTQFSTKDFLPGQSVDLKETMVNLTPQKNSLVIFLSK